MSARPVRWWQARWLQVVLSLVVVVVIFGFVFPNVADYGEVWQTIRDMTRIEIAALTLVALWNLASYWPALMAALPGLRLGEAATSNLASTAAANTLPGGAALGIGATATMQHSWGIPLSGIALASVVSGIWNNFLKLGLPVLALAVVAITGEVGAGLTLAAFVGLAVLAGAIGVFAVLLRSEPLARRIGALAGRAASAVVRPLHRGPVRGWDTAATRFRTKTVGLLKRRWLAITATTVISHLSLYTVLLVALRDVGVSDDEVSWAKVLAAFAFVRLLSAIPITPGGLGVVELGLTAALGAGLPDTTRNQIAAAVLLFRALTWFLPIPLGVAAWLFWRTNTTWRQTIDEREQTTPDVAHPPLPPAGLGPIHAASATAPAGTGAVAEEVG
jgi:putative heme transporter